MSHPDRGMAGSEREKLNRPIQPQPKPHPAASGDRAGNSTAGQSISSSQVSWWPVHEFIKAVVAQANVGPLPLAGTPAWMQLRDDDPRKLLAVAVDGEHHVLRTESAQVALAEASRAVAAAADWPEVAREVHARTNFRATRPWAKRVVVS